MIQYGHRINWSENEILIGLIVIIGTLSLTHSWLLAAEINLLVDQRCCQMIKHSALLIGDMVTWD